MELKKNNVLIIDKKYVIKKASLDILRAEKFFIENNKKIKVQKIINSNVDESYNLYKYIHGDTIHSLADVDNCLKNIYKLIKQYAEVDIKGYGYIFDLKKTWTEFLKAEIIKQSKYIKESKLNLTDQVMHKIKILEKYPIDQRLIHGDLGGFNIICKKKKIVGIIDPRTIIGDPIYDFIYFIFSNYNIANGTNLIEIFDIINEPKEKIFAMIYVLLYDRIAKEQKNNTRYKDSFFKIWNEIEKLEKFY